MRVIDLLAPPVCNACRAPLPRPGPVLCPACVAALPWIVDPCRRCALPAHGGSACPAGGLAFERAWSPLAYEGPARRLVQRLKFGQALPLAQALAAQLAAGLPPDLRGLPVVPVPPQRSRQRRRGFDPARLIAQAFSQRTGAAVVTPLQRADRARRHTTATRRARRAAPPLIDPICAAPEAVMLLDDVHTTGATLDACARALRDAGTQHVAAVTYARTLRVV